ncbi:MAG: UTP--glucose-1-phosphate uridylyltransferase [Kiritimatiellia bacterium]
MIAIIPAAGLGTRFLPLTRAVPKEMLPIGSKPAIQLIVDEALAAGCDEVVVIISPAKEIVRSYFSADPAYAGVIRWVCQREQRGLGHAVLQCAETCAGRGDRILILLGDAVVSGCQAAREMVALSQANGGASVIGAERVPSEKVSRYGILSIEGGRVVDLVEKPSPAEAPSDVAVAGRYLLDTAIFGYLKTQAPGKGGEIQLTDAIRRLIADPAHPLLPYVYPGKRHDLGNPQGYFATLCAFYGRQ